MLHRRIIPKVSHVLHRCANRIFSFCSRNFILVSRSHRSIIICPLSFSFNVLIKLFVKSRDICAVTERKSWRKKDHITYYRRVCENFRISSADRTKNICDDKRCTYNIIVNFFTIRTFCRK